MAETVLFTVGEPPAPITLADLFEANADGIDTAERVTIAADIERQGFHAGGGGAAARYFIGTEVGLRVALAHEVIATLREYLTPEEWAACQAGTTEPDRCCDSNEPVNEAFKVVFCENITDLEGPAQAQGFARWNSACRVASLLMVGTLTAAEALEVANFDDCKGLSHVVPGYTLETMRAALADVWED